MIYFSNRTFFLISVNWNVPFYWFPSATCTTFSSPCRPAPSSTTKSNSPPELHYSWSSRCHSSFYNRYLIINNLIRQFAWPFRIEWFCQSSKSRLLEVSRHRFFESKYEFRTQLMHSNLQLSQTFWEKIGLDCLLELMFNYFQDPRDAAGGNTRVGDCHRAAQKGDDAGHRGCSGQYLFYFTYKFHRKRSFEQWEIIRFFEAQSMLDFVKYR